MTSLFWRHLSYLEHSQSVQHFADQFSFTTLKMLEHCNSREKMNRLNSFSSRPLIWTWTFVYCIFSVGNRMKQKYRIIGRRQFETKQADVSMNTYGDIYERCKIITYSRSPWLLSWFWSCAVFFGYRRDFASRPWKSVYCVIISAFERSLMYTRKQCCGTETAWCRCTFDTYRNLQRHRAFLPAIARLSCFSSGVTCDILNAAGKWHRVNDKFAIYASSGALTSMNCRSSDTGNMSSGWAATGEGLRPEDVSTSEDSYCTALLSFGKQRL